MQQIIDILEWLDIEYMIGGSVASSHYGEPRSTVDIDIAVVLPLEKIDVFVRAFERLGYYIFREAVLDAVLTASSFNIIDAQSGYKADIFVVAPTALERSALARRRRSVYDAASGAEAYFYSPEDVILYKLKYYLQGRMDKHLRDIAAMLINLGDELDFDYISSWAARIGAADIWRELLAEYRARQTKGMTDES